MGRSADHRLAPRLTRAGPLPRPVAGRGRGVAGRGDRRLARDQRHDGHGDDLLSTEADLEEIDHEVRQAGERALEESVEAFRQTEADADGELTADNPLNRLNAVVRTRNTAEVVVLTRPHLVAEMLHLDWTTRARRKLSVPILHLVAQEEPDWESEVEDEQAAEAQAGEADDDGQQEK